MQCVKGCFVSGRVRRANTCHRREEVRKAIEKLKQHHPQELLSVKEIT